VKALDETIKQKLSQRLAVGLSSGA